MLKCSPDVCSMSTRDEYERHSIDTSTNTKAFTAQ